METEDFVVSGTCSEQMYGMCESLWEPDMVSLTFLHCFNTKMMTVYFYDCRKKKKVQLPSTVMSVSPAVKHVNTDCFSTGTGGFV